jgi:hypothetical protein
MADGRLTGTGGQGPGGDSGPPVAAQTGGLTPRRSPAAGAGESHPEFSALAPLLEEGLTRHLGRPFRAAAVEGRPLGRGSTHPISRLLVTADSGEQVPVIFKRLSPRPEPKGHRREVLVYRRLLEGQRFGAPALYASVYDEAGGRYWLFLEDVGRRTVAEGDLPDWAGAVRRLAELHGPYLGRADDLRALGCLGERGAGYYHFLAGRARRNLQQAEAGQALARFDALLAGFEYVVAHLVSQPQTLVHGDIHPDNFLLQPGHRVRLLDWETASVGLGALDLVRLLDGWGADRPKFVDIYWEELVRHRRAYAAPLALSVPFDREAFEVTLRYCALLVPVIHLGWDAERCRDASFVGEALRRLERYRQRLGERQGAC